jgi:error-prone DNA polymerase
MNPSFHEFHARSAFSFLEGASEPETMIRRAAEIGLESIAITDRDGFYGSARAHHAAMEYGVRAVAGAMIRLDGDAAFPVLCATRDGYRNLSRHLTGVHLGDPIGRDPFPKGPGECVADVQALPLIASSFHSPDASETRPCLQGGLIALTGDREGPVCAPLLRGNRAAALHAVEKLVAAFGHGNVFVELTRHGLRDDRRLNRHLMDLAAHLKLPLLACNAPLFATRGDRRLGDAFTCLRHHLPLDQAGRLLEPNGERHLKSPREMAVLFADVPEAVANTSKLADCIGFTLENLDYRFPDFHDEQGRPLSLEDQAILLRELSHAGAKQRYGRLTERIRHQLDHELAMIGKLGFPGYFLIVHDLVGFAKGRGILCQGRGSAANSAVCYALGITAVDPIGGGLLFERFLSENRRSWPDIDIDFPSGERREEVIQYLFQKHGARNAAMTANVITYRAKSAFREMSKVLGFPPSVADRFSNSPGAYHGEGEARAEMDRHEEFEERVSSILPPSHPRLSALRHLYQAVLGLPRHLGQHPGGMIICDHGLDAVVPLQPATMPGRTVVQWDKDDCEDMGIVKIDLLGLGMLAAMENALEIRARRGHPVDLAAIPKDDPAVFGMLRMADTIGTFQVESRAQMATLPIMKPATFYDLVIEVAIIRPGPIVGDLVHPYLNRRNGREPIDYIHPDCREILERTLGVPLFQEQVLRMAMAVAGFSGAEADELRRAMSFKRSDERMARVTEKLRRRMSERGIALEVQDKLVASIGSFALYGFPESHAISFALIAYASCWLKAHHPAEFYTGLLNHQPMGFYSVNTLIQDAKRRGLRVLPVCCLASGLLTDVDDDRVIRLGLNHLKGLSAATAARIVSERERLPFDSLEDFLRRVKPGVKEKRLLAQAGALNALEQVGHRRHALWRVEPPLHDDLLETPSLGNEVLPPMTMAERMSADFLTQGASTGPHPMKLWRGRRGEKQILRARDLHSLPHGMPVAVGGMVICRQRPGTAKGHCFISLEDETGIANLFVKRETFQRLRLVITSEPFLLARGIVQRSEGDQPTVYVHGIEPLPDAEMEHGGRSHDFH